MTNLIKSWNGRTIRIRDDRFVSLTDMAQATGKRVNDYLRLGGTKAYVDALSESTGFTADNLIQVNESFGSNDERGTWGHPYVAVEFAQWCDVYLKIQCNRWLDELLTTGKVELVQQPKLVEPLSRELQLKACEMLFKLNERTPDDRTTVTLKAHLTNLIEADQKTSDEPQLLSVTEVLEMEGIKIPSGKDSVIGRKVAKAWRESYTDEPQTTVKHIGSGHRTANIKVYPREFFERITAIAQEYLEV